MSDDELERLTETRRSLHAVAELLLAGPQHRASETIRLAVTPTGFRTIAEPDIRLDGTDLVVGDKRAPLRRSFAHVADSMGFTAASPFDLYDEGPDDDPRRTIDIDEESRARIIAAFNVGDAALRAFAPDQTPVLWPEHFDVSTTVADVTYGVSAGDEEIPQPYAYAAPTPKRTGPFWAYSFGAAVPVTGATTVEEIVRFFRSAAAS